ncbi:centrosomal protein of 78 kDa [Solea senegalensis]|uniref:Centrosomal protein of 78 kDa n=1 Tax=Solea senegalensis TaxID=28829 RepID=A0AAV6SK82_SOLSE|nr:centrosomal protein of 78 kDa [Solea senegalensis]
MKQNNARMLRQGATDFLAYYGFACARQDSMPLTAIKRHLDKGMLDFNGDRLDLRDLQPVLSSISINQHLNHIAIRSTHLGSENADKRYYRPTSRREIPFICSKDMTLELCKALRECLTISSNLKTLQLNGLPLNKRDLITLKKGLEKSMSLEHLSLANCPISDEGLEVICKIVKHSPNIKRVDFSGCNLTWRGAEHIASIIKYQGAQRQGIAWAESLRYRHPHLEEMGGLRRVTLNGNSLIGDCGAAAIGHELAEDFWMKAVDLQRCGLSNEGAHHLLEAVKTNSVLCVLDIHSNPLVDKGLIKAITEKVKRNRNSGGQSLQQYHWIKPAATEPQRVPGPRKQPVPRRIRTASCNETSAETRSSSVAPVRKPPPRSQHVPRHAAARAGRRRGLPRVGTVAKQSFNGATTDKIAGEKEEKRLKVYVQDQEGVSGRQFDRLQMELSECRLRLAKESTARLRAESRLKEYEIENACLPDAKHSMPEAFAAAGSRSAPRTVSVLEDEALLETIEKSFVKFHAFLDLLRDAGLGKLAAMAGLDASDFHLLGKPQLSTTTGTYLDVRNAMTQTVAFHSLVNSAPPTLPDGQRETATPRSPSSIRKHFFEDIQQDVTISKASDPALQSGMDGEGPDQYYKPYFWHDVGPEHSVYSKKSVDEVLFGESHQIQQSGSSSTSSHLSDLLHRSPDSQSNGSHGRSSVRSNITCVSVGSDG